MNTIMSTIVVDLTIYAIYLTYLCIKHGLIIFYKPTAKSSKKEIGELKMTHTSENEKRLQKELEEISKTNSDLQEKVNKLLKVY